MRVRRSSDNAEADIGFNSTGFLDQTALLAHTGASSGFVRTWYDQSGAALNMVQATNGNQPRIVNAGVVEVINNLPTVRFIAASATYLTMATAYAFANAGSWYLIYNLIDKAGDGIFTGAPTALNDFPAGFLLNVNGAGILNTFVANLGTGSTLSVATTYAVDWVLNLGMRINAAQTDATTFTGTPTINTTTLGARQTPIPISQLNGYISETLLYLANHNDSQRRAIESNEIATWQI
jgi:hypothetical protein